MRDARRITFHVPRITLILEVDPHGFCGRHLVRVCDGTACHVKGAAKNVEAVEKALDVKAGGTHPSSLEVVMDIYTSIEAVLRNCATSTSSRRFTNKWCIRRFDVTRELIDDLMAKVE
jgi:hypothetical protein